MQHGGHRPGEGRLAVEKLVEHRAQRVNVRSDGRIFAEDLLGCQVSAGVDQARGAAGIGAVVQQV